MSLKKLEINHLISSGNLVSQSMQVQSSTVSVLAKFSNIPTSDVVVSLEQSVDSINFTPVPNSSKSLNIGHLLHQWNITGLVSGMYIRLIAVANTATSGSVDYIKIID